MQLIRFLIVGAANTAVGFAVIYGLMYFASADKVTANMGGYAVGLLVSFVFNKAWVFQSSGSTISTLPRFLLVFAASYLVNLVVLNAAVSLAGINAYIAQLIAAAFYSSIFFVGCRIFAFGSAPSDGISHVKTK